MYAYVERESTLVTCIYIYTYICFYRYKHIYIFVYSQRHTQNNYKETQIHKQEKVETIRNSYTEADTHETNNHINTQTQKNLDKWKYTHTHAHTNILTHIQTDTHLNSHTYI